MAPISQVSDSAIGLDERAHGLNGESIVISGMSGLFPQSDNVKMFSSILYNKVNPVTWEDSPWKLSHPESSEYVGKIPGVDRFDSQFFMVHNRLGNCMDPMARKALEQTFQAIYDAGISPQHLNAKNVGVFLATAQSEMEKFIIDDIVTKVGYRITGSSRSMYANRISYWLNIKGPSITFDDACCGSSVALEEAYIAIKNGTCEAAIVASTNLFLLPHTQVHYNRCIKSSPGAETKSFDENASGCTKSEAISILFLQKAKHALRSYAELVYVKNEFTSKLSGATGQMYGFARNPDDTASFLKQFYAEAHVSPQAVEYIEAFGTDTDEDGTVSLVDKTEHSDVATRPLWFVYSGMGSQWAGMGVHLMRIPIFAAAIERCQKILEPKGINVVHIITSLDKTIFDDVLNAFVGIAAIQIGLTNILLALGLRPDFIIGHSVGELGCAYADGCLTAEEMILSAYSRGKASNVTPLIPGAMAAVGLGYQQLVDICPPSIDIACHNSATSSTISGPEEKVREFVSVLTTKGIFAKEVPSANIAYHSRYIVDAAPNLQKLLSEIIPEPRVRSERWLSTSVPQERWGEPAAKYCSAEYLTNNLLSSVYFEETSTLIPGNAVLVEIAPHGLLQAILKRSVPETCKNIPLTQRGHKDNAVYLLDAIGNLYIEGFTPQLQAIYPTVEFPVSTGTPHLSHHIKWIHTDTWDVANLHMYTAKSSSSYNFSVTIHDDEYIYLKGNVIQGQILYPFAAALVAVWDTLAMTLGRPKKSVSVQFSNIHLYSQPILHGQTNLKIKVSVHRGSGLFEVMNGDYKMVTGYTKVLEQSVHREFKQPSQDFIIDSDEVYEALDSRGFNYRDMFRSIHTANESLTEAQMLWNDNWITLIDGMIQLNALKTPHEGISQLYQIRDFSIDIEQHLESMKMNSMTPQIMIAEIDEALDCTRCGGITLQNLKFYNMTRTQENFTIETPSLLRNDIEIVEKHFEEGKSVSLQIEKVGNLDTLHWELSPSPLDHGIKVKVEYAGITISDVKRATGIIPYESNEKFYGMDFSGLTESGERVMGLVSNGSASSVVLARPELLWPVPTNWSLEEAATVPLAYFQAFYCLCVKTKLNQGSKVLVHGAVGALGQAAIAVALEHGCRVFATVANNAKKRFLHRLFPQLNEDSIGCSRDDSFGDMVLSATNGEGCDIILSCVREDLKNVSLKCAAFSGITIDMVQIQNRDKYNYGMFNMTKQRSYVAADIYSVLDSKNVAELKKLQILLSEGISRGFVRPLTRMVFDAQEAPRAFRMLSASRHYGRVLLRLCDSTPFAQARIVCSPHSGHLIVCDGGPFGLQLADRLISRGARKIRIYYMKPTKQHLLKLRLWKNLGVDIKIETLDDCRANDIILDGMNQFGAVEGIYVAVTSKLTTEQTDALAKFVDILDTSSRTLCPQIKYFAIISTTSEFSQQISISRFKDGFSATTLNLSDFTNARTKNDVMASSYFWTLCAVDVTEEALQCGNPVVIAKLQAVEKPSIYKQLKALFDNNDDELTLRNLGIGDSTLPCLKSILRDIYHVSLEDEEILSLTKKRILELERNMTVHKLKKIDGFKKFFSYVDDDELLQTADLISMNTIVQNVETLTDTKNESKLMVHGSAPTIIIIPGLEGHHARFYTLCERLKVPAFVLQPGLDYPDETPTELATRYSQVLLKNFKLSQNIYLLGYEHGVIVALELASILENFGWTGTVYCLGAGPEETKSLLEAELSTFSDEDALQAGLARHMCALMAGDAAHAPDERALLGCGSWRSRVDACVRALLGRVSHSAQYARALLEAAYARIATQRCYKAEPRALRSQLVLMRPRDVPRATGPSSLQSFSQRPLIEHDIDAPMALATEDLRVSNFINRYLDNDVLEAFKSLNLCETYLSQ